MQLIDTHCHLTFKPLANDVEAILEKSISADVTVWLTVGTTLQDSIQAVNLAKKHKNLFATVGLHPHDAKNFTPQLKKELITLAKEPEVVAIGEAGLDYHYTLSPKEQQITAFENQIEIATETGLPLIIHSRSAFDETFDILGRYKQGLTNVVFHCFGGSTQQAKIITENNWFVSFTGIITFKNAREAQQSAAEIPLERIMLETDAPYISPEPVRNQKPNEPALLIHTAAKLAELKQTTLDEIARQTTENAVKFFNLNLD